MKAREALVAVLAGELLDALDELVRDTVRAELAAAPRRSGGAG